MKFKNLNIIVLIVFLILPTISQKSLAATPTCYKPTKETKAYINVSVANLWKDPSAKRDIDKYSLLNPVDMKTWTSKMSTFDSRKWLVGKMETQALYGQEVKVLDTKDSWAQVAIKNQYTPKNQYGYPGWLLESQIINQNTDYNDCHLVVVKSKTTNLYYFNDKNKKFMELSFNTVLPIVKVEEDWVEVITPTNQPKWIKKGDVNMYNSLTEIPKPTGQDLVDTASRFKGLSYVWAGISSYGFDCSGFTYAVYKHHGITIPRDSTEQYKKGTFVLKSNLKPGDLMFFAGNNGKGNVHHVAMYIGNGKMIHSPTTGKKIEITSINALPYKQEYAGSRRYLQ